MGRGDVYFVDLDGVLKRFEGEIVRFFAVTRRFKSGAGSGTPQSEASRKSRSGIGFLSSFL
jgi:hypothetical protein